MLQVIGILAGILLLGVAALHVVWAFSPWPLPDRLSFARTVVGVPDETRLPGTALTLAVAGLLVAAGYLVLAGAGVVPVVATQWLTRAGTVTVAAALGLRAVVGFVTSGAVRPQAPPEFRHWDLRAYSPLCLVLTVLVAAVATGWPAG